MFRRAAVTVALALGLLSFSPALAQPAPPDCTSSVTQCVYMPLAHRSLVPQLTNGDFELGASVWGQVGTTSSVIRTGAFTHSGQYYAHFSDLFTPRASIALTQTITVPFDRPYLSYWFRRFSRGSCSVDTSYVALDPSPATGDAITIDSYELCEETTTGDWTQRAINLTPYIGQQFDLIFLFQTGGTRNNSSWSIDDIAFQADATVAPAPRRPLYTVPLNENDIDLSGTFFEELDRAVENEEAAENQPDPAAALRAYERHGRLTSWRREFGGSQSNSSGLLQLNSQVIEYRDAQGPPQGAAFIEADLRRERWTNLGGGHWRKRSGTRDLHQVLTPRCYYLVLTQFTTPAGFSGDEGEFLDFRATEKAGRACSGVVN